MPLLMLKDLPRYECLLEASREFPDLDPSAAEVFLHLLRTGDEAFRVVEAHLAQHEITQGRFGVLMALWGNCQREGRAVPLSPAEIADRTGFVHVEYMCVLFKRVAGETPGQYRRNQGAQERERALAGTGGLEV